LVEGGDGLTATGDVLGTPAYMSPEQASGELSAVDARSDVYGLGATLYEALTGTPPFSGPTPVNVLSRVINKPVAPPRSLVASVSASIETICLTCLRKERGDRYPTAAALAEDLESFLAGREISAREPGRGRRATRWVRRNPLAILVLALVVAAVPFAYSVWTKLRVAELREEARQLVHRGGHEEELARSLNEMLRLEGRTLSALTGAADLYAQGGHVARAEALYEEAVQAHPPAYSALLGLHRLAQRRDPRSRMTVPLERLLEASAGDEESEFALFAGAELAFHNGLLAEALKDFSRVIERAPRFPWAYVARAAVYARQGKDGRVIGDCTTALEIDDRIVEALVNRGSALCRLGRLDEALRDFSRALDLDPGFGPAHLNMGLALRARGREDDALVAFVTALAVAPRLADHLDESDLEKIRRGRRPTGTVVDVDRVSPLAPLSYDSVLERGRRHLKAGDLVSASADFDRALALDPGSADAYAARAEARRRAGKLNEAWEDCNSALLSNPGHVIALCVRGRVFEAKGNAQRAGEDWRAALGLLEDGADPALRAEVEGWLKALGN
jgi:tetratricopeptide (TPR) repeat protein